MDLKVGKYALNGEFKSRKQAKETFLTHFPAVTESDLENELNKHFKKDADQSRNIIEPVAESDSSSSDIDKGTVGKKQSRKD